MNSNELIQELIRDEGLRLKPYRCTAGKLTIGVGHNLEDNQVTLNGVRYDRNTAEISESEATSLLRYDIGYVVIDLDVHIPWWTMLSERRQRALANMCFNLGVGRLLGFRKMLHALASAQYEEAARQALDSKWARQVGARSQRIAAMIREG